MSQNRASINLEPVSWPEIRLRFCLTLNPSKQEIRDIPKDTELSFIPMEAVGEDGSLDISTTRPIEDVESGYTFFRDDDVAIAKITPCFENGKGCIFKNLVNGYGFGTTELTVMRPEGLVPAYLYYLTISHHFRSMGIGLMQGSAGQKRVPDNFIRDYVIELPSESEQQAIVSYLDQETGRIDTLIQKKEQVIELLKEKRVTLITQAVTKGLDPNAKMKDSGIGWLGEVPDHWNILRIDSVTNYSRSQIDPDSIESDTVFHYSIPVVQKTGTGQYEPTDDLGSSKRVVDMRTVLISKLNPRKSTICIAEPMDEITLCSTEFVALQATNCELKYLYYLMNSELNRQRLDSRVQSVTRSHQRVNPSDIYRFWIAIPPRGEQLSIVSHLDQETRCIDALIQKNEQMIELLKEYRSSLIHHAVTGKIDVRGYHDKLQ